MKVDVKLFAGLKCDNAGLPFFGESDFQLEVPDGTALRDLRNILKINPALPLLCIVNNVLVQEEFRLSQNDQVGMFPPISGG